MVLTDARIEECRISEELSSGGVSGRGTAPAPTPTPIPEVSSRNPDTVAQEMRVFGDEINPVIASLSGYSKAFQYGWQFANKTGKQAAQLNVFGNRLAQLCSAVSQNHVPPEVIGETVGFGESIRISHAWTVLALAELNCCGSAQTSFLDVGFEATSLEISNATLVLNSAVNEYLGSSSGSPDRVVESERFDLQLRIAKDAIVVRNSIDIAVVFPEINEILDPISLGPDSWMFGTGIRIRRLRNSSELTIEQAVVEYEGFVHRFGEPVRSFEVDFQMPNEIQFDFPVLENGWNASTIVWVNNGFTYFAEYLCLPGGIDSCEHVQRSIESIRVAQ